MGNKTCIENQLKLALQLSSPPSTNNDNDKVINFDDYRLKKEKDFFFSTVDYLTKHLQK
jgi:hypothetical protein